MLGLHWGTTVCSVLCCTWLLSPVWLFVAPGTVAGQVLLSMGQEHWSGLPCPPPGDLPHPGIEPRSSSLCADPFPYEPPGKPMNTDVGSLSFLQGSSWPRNGTGASHIAGGFFTSWATTEALVLFRELPLISASLRLFLISCDWLNPMLPSVTRLSWKYDDPLMYLR